MERLRKSRAGMTPTSQPHSGFSLQLNTLLTENLLLQSKAIFIRQSCRPWDSNPEIVFSNRPGATNRPGHFYFNFYLKITNKNLTNKNLGLNNAYHLFSDRTKRGITRANCGNTTYPKSIFSILSQAYFLNQ